MSKSFLKEKFRKHFEEVFPQAKKDCLQVIESENVFFQFTDYMIHEQLALKASYQSINTSLLEKKNILSKQCISLHLAFLKDRDEHDFFNRDLIAERQSCEEELLQTIVKLTQLEKILVDIQRVLEEISYLETISIF
jgi:hypothetical protein